MKNIILILMLFGCNTVFAQDIKADLKLVEAFSTDIRNPEKKLENIVQSYLCKLDDATFAGVLFQLKSLRTAIEGKELIVQTFSQIPENESNISFGAEESVYRLLANQKHACFFLVKDGIITSFATMTKGKGGHRVFLKLCGK